MSCKIQVLNNEDGAQLTEYVIVLSLAVIVAVIAYEFLGLEISSMVSDTVGTITSILNN